MQIKVLLLTVPKFTSQEKPRIASEGSKFWFLPGDGEEIQIRKCGAEQPLG
jgi:hypothetical protein